MTRTLLALAALLPALVLHSYAPDGLTAALAIGCWVGLCAIASILWLECDRTPGKVIAINHKTSTAVARIGLIEHSRMIQPALIGRREDGERTPLRLAMQRTSNLGALAKHDLATEQEADRRAAVDERTLAVAEVAMRGFPSAEDQRLGLAMVPTLGAK